MSLKKFTVTLDPEKVDNLRKSGAELSSFLRSCMEEKVVSSTKGVRVGESEISKNSKRIESLELKTLKMDSDFKTAQNKFNHAFKRIINAMRRMGIDG